MSVHDREAEQTRRNQQESFDRWRKVYDQPKTTHGPRYPTVEPRVKIQSPDKPEKKKHGFLTGLLVFGFLAYMLKVGFSSPQDSPPAAPPSMPQWTAPQPAPKAALAPPQNKPLPQAQPKAQTKQLANAVPGVRVDMATGTAEVVAGDNLVVDARWFQSSGTPVTTVAVDLWLRAGAGTPRDLGTINLHEKEQIAVPIPKGAAPGRYQLLAQWNSKSGGQELMLPFEVVTTASANPPTGGSRAYGAIGPD